MAGLQPVARYRSTSGLIVCARFLHGVEQPGDGARVVEGDASVGITGEQQGGLDSSCSLFGAACGRSSGGCTKLEYELGTASAANLGLGHAPSQ